MSLNKVMLIGNVGKEPEVRYVEEGVATAVFSLATTTRGYTLPNGTVVPERTEWHRVLVWRKLAEVVEKYVHTADATLWVSRHKNKSESPIKRGMPKSVFGTPEC